MHRGCRGRSHCGNGSRHYGREDLRQKKLGHGYCGVGRRDNSQAAAAGEETKHTAAAADATATATLRRCPRGRPSQPDALRADHPKNTARPATRAVAKSSGCLSKRRRWWRWRCSKKKKKKGPHEAKFVLLITIASSRPRLGAAWPRTQQRVLTEGGQCKGSSREMM